MVRVAGKVKGCRKVVVPELNLYLTVILLKSETWPLPVHTTKEKSHAEWGCIEMCNEPSIPSTFQML
jgi:hypothetical protein